ncbi:MAG: transposase [Bacteroidota bacterium]|nr:transposase [Bacteroidota bacterium]
MDTCTYPAIHVAQVPRIQCSEHGVKTVRVPWADLGSRYTHGFEEDVIGWSKEASILAVSRQLGIGWKGIAGIIHRAVGRGLERRIERVVANVYVDDVSDSKGYKYHTIVSGADTGTVLYEGIGRDKPVLARWFVQFSPAWLDGIRSVSMDMWPACFRAIQDDLLNAELRICFDRFDVAKRLGKAVDKVRSRGFRNRDRFVDAIYFHLGGFDLSSRF